MIPRKVKCDDRLLNAQPHKLPVSDGLFSTCLVFSLSLLLLPFLLLISSQPCSGRLQVQQVIQDHTQWVGRQACSHLLTIPLRSFLMLALVLGLSK